LVGQNIVLNASIKLEKGGAGDGGEEGGSG